MGEQAVGGQASGTKKRVGPVKEEAKEVKGAVPVIKGQGKRSADAAINPSSEAGVKVARIVPMIREVSENEGGHYPSFFAAYLSQLTLIVHAIALFLSRKYAHRELVITSDYDWLLKKILSQAHRLDDILTELGVELTIFTRHYHAIKRDFVHFYVYEILYRVELMKRSVCPHHGPGSFIDSSPGSIVDTLMRKATSDADEIYSLLNVKGSEFTIDDPLGED
ncbi:MAG: hypothetical protein GY858_05485 [Candidatus Omnitrophica bacterium]|nr:hypothetical protein [Candidatus Omnitrophota bacterium]